MPDYPGKFLFELGNVPVYYLSRDHDLPVLARLLEKVSHFSFDTEFDRFRHSYGFSLYLLQIFDGTACWLVDTLALRDLSPLYPVFANRQILKILYSGKEDIDLLRRWGCPVRNLFDVQSATRICNHEAVSFARLVASETGVELNKSEQTSNWRRRPLTRGQLEYAAQDVIPLPGLMEKFRAEVESLGRTAILEEENRLAEEYTTSDNAPRLNPGMRARYPAYHQAFLLQLIELRDEAARRLNLPPYRLVSDDVLEEIIRDPEAFRLAPFERGFARRALDQPGFREGFLRVAAAIDPDVSFEKEKEKKSPEEWNRIRESRERYEKWFRPVRQNVLARYGAVAGEFFMVGVRDALCSPEPEPSRLKTYQRQMVMESAGELGLEWPEGW